MIAFGNKAGFVALNQAISLMFDAKYSFIANNIFVRSVHTMRVFGEWFYAFSPSTKEP
jgi:hypothetical protein